MSRLLIAITLALLAIMAASPAPAQAPEPPDGITDERFRTQETRDLSAQINEARASYDANEDRIEQLEENNNFGNERDRLWDEVGELDDQIPLLEEDLAEARLEAIQDADAPPADKVDALESLEVFASDNVDFAAPVQDNITDDLSAAEDDVAAAREAEQQAQEEAEQQSASGDGGGDDSGGSDDAASSTSASDSGSLASALGSIVSSIVGFLVSVIILTALTLGIMAFIRYRRTGSATAASSAVLSKPRILLALGIAVILSLMNFLGAVWILLQGLLIILAIPLALVIAVAWWWGGSLRAGLQIIGRWLPFIRDARRGSDPGSEGGGPPGGGSPPGGGPIIGGGGAPNVQGPQEDTRPALQKYLRRDLTQDARDGRLDEVVGRDDEIDSVIEILNRRKANNAAITGPAGVGKTVLVEALAQKLVEGRVPPQLQGKEVLELDLTAINSGATLVGMFEERLQGVIDEVKAEPDRYILFVDEMHSLMTTGASANNPTGSADILKPALARGELRMIGATTLDEYREIEQDPAMARRFGRVNMPPLSVEQTIELLPSTAREHEDHYDLSIEQDALTATAKLSKRHIGDQALPGAATNLLETVCSSVALRGGDTVTADDVARIVTRQTGVPVGGTSDDDRQKVLDLEKNLRQRMVGQDDAVTAVADAIRRKRSGFGSDRPVSCGFFGVTGVGKTELAKALAEVLFGDENAMVRLDMSEYSTSTASGGGSKWKLIGSDKGFMASDEGGELTEPVRRRPYSVVLFDEIEKANTDVLDPLLAILDDGHVTDGRGRKVDFSNTIVIMTSNLAADVVADRWRKGLNLSEDELGGELVQRGLRPELVQRLGKIAVFEPLQESEVEEIAHNMLSKTSITAAEEHGLTVSYDPQVVAEVARLGYDPENGLRPLRRVIERQIEGPLSDFILNDGPSKSKHLTWTVKPDGSIGARRSD